MKSAAPPPSMTIGPIWAQNTFLEPRFHRLLGKLDLGVKTRNLGPRAHGPLYRSPLGPLHGNAIDVFIPCRPYLLLVGWHMKVESLHTTTPLKPPREG